MAFHGMRVTPEDRLFEIADLSTVWVLADVYEKRPRGVRVGHAGRVALPSMPGPGLARAGHLHVPDVEAEDADDEVRVEVDNPDRILKPDMFADVFLETALGLALIVPESAVDPTGERTLVFVDHGGGRYEPREVVLGGPRRRRLRRCGAGVAAGERVVVSANFLLDSESSLPRRHRARVPVDAEH